MNTDIGIFDKLLDVHNTNNNRILRRRVLKTDHTMSTNQKLPKVCNVPKNPVNYQLFKEGLQHAYLSNLKSTPVKERCISPEPINKSLTEISVKENQCPETPISKQRRRPGIRRFSEEILEQVMSSAKKIISKKTVLNKSSLTKNSENNQKKIFDFIKFSKTRHPSKNK